MIGLVKKGLLSLFFLLYRFLGKDVKKEYVVSAYRNGELVTVRIQAPVGFRVTDISFDGKVQWVKIRKDV